MSPRRPDPYGHFLRARQAIENAQVLLAKRLNKEAEQLIDSAIEELRLLKQASQQGVPTLANRISDRNRV